MLVNKKKDLILAVKIVTIIFAIYGYFSTMVLLFLFILPDDHINNNAEIEEKYEQSSNDEYDNNVKEKDNNIFFN